MLPSKFIGNSTAIEQLTGFIPSPPNSLIVVGPPNIGRSTAIRRYIATKFCEKSNQCGECEPCRLLANDQHPDAKWLEYEQGEVDSRELVEFLHADNYRPALATHRFRVINLIDCPRTDALSRLLKVMEEPLSDNTIIIITPSCQWLLPTLVSRSVVVSFSAPSFAECVDILKLQWSSVKPDDLSDVLYWVDNDLSIFTESPEEIGQMVTAFLAYLMEVKPDSFYELSEFAAACAESPELSSRIACEWLSKLLLAVVTDKEISNEDQAFVNSWQIEGLNLLLGVMINYRRLVLNRQSYVNHQLYLEEKLLEIGSEVLQQQVVTT